MEVFNLIWNIIFTIIRGAITAFIMYKCCEKFDFKITWLALFALLTGFYIISLFSLGYFIFMTFLKNLILFAIISAITTLLYYKIYGATNSLIGFIFASLLIQFIITIVW